MVQRTLRAHCTMKGSMKILKFHEKFCGVGDRNIIFGGQRVTLRTHFQLLIRRYTGIAL